MNLNVFWDVTLCSDMLETPGARHQGIRRTYAGGFSETYPPVYITKRPKGQQSVKRNPNINP